MTIDTIRYIVVGGCAGIFLTVLANGLLGWPSVESVFGGLFVGAVVGYIVAVIRGKNG